MDSIRLSPESVERCRATYPEAAAYLEAHDHYVPDSLKDTTRMRAQKAQGLLERMERLKAISGCDALLLVTFDLRSLDVLPLYSNRTIKQAQKLVEALFRRTDVSAFIWKLERGRNGGTHVHALIPADSDLMEFNDYEIVQSGEERKVAQYLCKPADARACGRRTKDLPVWTPEQLDEQRMAAIDDFVTRLRNGKERLCFLRSHGLRRTSQYPTCYRSPSPSESVCEGGVSALQPSPATGPVGAPTPVVAESPSLSDVPEHHQVGREVCPLTPSTRGQGDIASVGGDSTFHVGNAPDTDSD